MCATRYGKGRQPGGVVVVVVMAWSRDRLPFSFDQIFSQQTEMKYQLSSWPLPASPSVLWIWDLWRSLHLVRSLCPGREGCTDQEMPTVEVRGGGQPSLPSGQKASSSAKSHTHGCTRQPLPHNLQKDKTLRNPGLKISSRIPL